MGENDQPPPPPSGPPPEWDQEQIRRFQEFQRFQEYQRFAEAQHEARATSPPGQDLVPAPPAGPPARPPQPGQPGGPAGVPEVAEQLTGMQQQLAELTAAQAQAIKAAHRPLWRKVLANKWTHRAIALVVVLVLAVWGIPALVGHYFGGDGDNAGGPGAQLPLPKNQSREYPSSPDDVITAAYQFVAYDNPQQFCFLFTDNGTRFAQVNRAANCTAAVTALHRQVTDPGSYATPRLKQQRDTSQSPLTLASCDFSISGGPLLGVFTVTRQPDRTWAITGYRAGPAGCTPSTVGGAPPTTGAPLTGGGIPTGGGGIPTGSGGVIPTGGFTGIPGG